MRMNMVMKKIVVVLGLVTVLMAVPAFALDFYSEHFTTAESCNIGSSYYWKLSGNSPWTGSWDSASALQIALGQPVEGQDSRIQSSASNLGFKFSDYPWAMMSVTIAGLPAGETVNWSMQFFPNEISNGKVRRFWDLGNGTHTLIMYMGDQSSYDADGSTDVYDPLTMTCKRIRFHMDATTVAGYMDPAVWGAVSYKIDWIRVTDEGLNKWHFLSANQSALNQDWKKAGNTTIATSWTSPSTMHLTMGPTVADDARLQSNRTLNFKFSDYPWAKMVLTVGGVPEGEFAIVSMQYFPNEIANGKVRKFWNLGNGTHTLIMYMGDQSAYDADLSTDIYDPETMTVKRIRIHIDPRNITDYLLPEVYNLFTFDIDYIGAADEVEGPGEPGPGEIVANADPTWGPLVGTLLTLTGPAGTDYRWFKDGQLVENDERITGATTQVLTFDTLVLDDSGSYVCVYDNGDPSKIYTETPPYELMVIEGGLPVAGIAGIGLTIAALGMLAARRMRRR